MRLTLFLTLVSTLAVVVALLEPQRLLAAERWHGAGAGDALLFTCAYGVAAAAFVPRPLLGLLAGAVFGVPAGAAVAVGGTVLGSLLCFALGRGLGQEASRPVIDRAAWLRAADRQLSEHGFRTVVALRLLPGVPFAASNYVAALSRLRWPVFLTASALGSLPQILLYAWAGDRATQPVSAVQLAVAGLLAVVLLVLAPLLQRRLIVAFAATRA